LALPELLRSGRAKVSKLVIVFAQMVIKAGSILMFIVKKCLLSASKNNALPEKLLV
jgi:hypothetical protein